MIIRTEGWSDIGLERKNNQDRIFFAEKEQMALAVVADGMGGHEDGAFASAVICELFREWWELTSCQNTEGKFQAEIEEMKAILEKANRRIKNGTADDTLCGSTAVVLLIDNGRFALLSVGDSRCYRLQKIAGAQLRQLSVDDVWEKQKGIRRRYSRQEIRTHEDYGKLIRAIGVEYTLECRVRTGRVLKKTVFVLCSDGVYQYCEKAMIKTTLNNILCGEDIKENLEKIRRKVYQNGAPDNLSMIAVHVF